MNFDLQMLNEIFSAVHTTLVEHSDYSAEEFNKEFDVFKHYKGKHLCDNDYYSILVDVVFYSGFRASTVNKYMPSIKKHFPNYETVMEYGEDALDKIMNDSDMIKNSRKIRACIKNAKRFDEIIKRYGSFEVYVNSFAPDENDANLIRFKEDLERFQGLGRITTYHFMTDIGLDVIKPDRVLMRIFKRLGLIKNTDDLFGAIEAGRQFSRATNLPIRYIDIIFVLYGQLNVPRLKCICAEKNPNCGICGANKFCGYSKRITDADDNAMKISSHRKKRIFYKLFPCRTGRSPYRSDVYIA